ncbi:MAG: ATP-binding protein [Pyrinomonadaceae bacterium]
MIEEKSGQKLGEKRVVYSRIRSAEESESARGGGKKKPSASSGKRASLWRAIVPILIGFVVLVALVVGLGVLSVKELNKVSDEVLDLQRQQWSRLGLLLNLRVAASELNNEARARDVLEERGGLIPPIALPLRNARSEMRSLLTRFESSPFAESERGRNFINNVREFIQTTEDLRRYSLEGFERYRTVDSQLDEFLREGSSRQDEILRHSEELQEQAGRRIDSLTRIAAIAGLIVAAITLWEAYRRFRQLRRSLAETEREREFSRQILEGMVSAVAAIDSRARIRSANQAFFRLFPAATINASVGDEVASGEALQMLEATTAALAEHSTYRGRWVLNGDPDMPPQTFDAYASPLDIEGEHGLVVTLVDVSEAAEAEAELRRKASLAAVGQAAAQLAHEIKNPLGSIRLGVSLLRDMAQEPQAISTLDLVERGIEHLNNLTLDVTQFSIEKPLALADTNLNKLLDRSLELVRDRTEEKRITVERKFSDEELCGMLDADQLRQVFVNLLANATDASADGETITITTERAADKPGVTERGHSGKLHHAPRARVTITDHGAGVDERTRAHIFEPFFTTKKRGTGLGLAITKKIVEQHDGTINVESTPGEGTRFIIELPLIKA